MTKSKPLPPLQLVRELFDYDKESGIVTWRTPRSNRVKAGETVGTIRKAHCKSYYNVRIATSTGKSDYKLHRIIWLHVTGEDPADSQIDHIDGNGLNNSFANLRKASASQNQCNVTVRRNSSSGLKGAHWHTQSNKWRARICFLGTDYYLGLFETPELAHMAYCKAAAELHGEFARGA